MKEHSLGKSLRSGAWGLLLGSAVGFALGLLFAPEEGKRVRRKLAYQLDKLGEQASDFIDAALNDEDGESAARQEGDALVKDAREKADQIRTDIDALLGEMRQQPDS